ncbi:LOW QUALITY PROTEIN: olfactory receptor 1500-like [Hyla sarda]|uniref:LOW QUALITY PROTEIN: olfactory receptor 1500-like n=1 Tax=Hyla sarda TaxID=327740 RepID=UPI0024C38664|nr:LOW QUALITY PROTEIN: olfactory receptor 1500-like [Hyla sarda]
MDFLLVRESARDTIISQLIGNVVVQKLSEPEQNQEALSDVDIKTLNELFKQYEDIYLNRFTRKLTLSSHFSLLNKRNALVEDPHLGQSNIRVLPTLDTSSNTEIKHYVGRTVQTVRSCMNKHRSNIYIQENNRTEVTEFLLLGFQVSRGLRLFLFCLFLVVYNLIIYGNLLIITLVSTSKNLHTPMYFFISHLSISDILLSTDIVPNMLHILLNNRGAMTFIGCITQYYFFSSSEVFECFLLAVMSYDRYVAICNPRRYSSIMTSGHCVILTVICWLFGFSVTLILIITIAKLNFCGHNIIDHLFCDLLALLKLSCSDTFIVQFESYVISVPTVFIPTTIIVVSYTYIVLAILRIPSNTGRQKAFSTCSSHLIVVSIFYGTLFGVYIVPTKGQTVTMSKILSLLYTVFTPLVNPIIYSLRNKDIRKAVQETLHKHLIWKSSII